MGRGQCLAILVEQSAGERTRGWLCRSTGPSDRMLGEKLLGLVPEFAIDERLVSTRVADLQVANFALIDGVREQFVKLAARIRLATQLKAVPSSSNPGDEPPSIQVLLEEPHRLEFSVAPEDQADGLRFHRVDDQPSIALYVADRHEPAHPHALLLRRSDLVADALAGDFAFELCERQEHVQGEATHRSGGIELLSHSDKRGAVRIQDLDHLREVRQRAGEAVDLVHHDDVDLTLLDVREQTPEGRTLHAPTR